MIKIKSSGCISFVKSYKCTMGNFIINHFRIGMFVYLANNEITTIIGQRAIGVIYAIGNDNIDVFCGDGIIETNYFGGGHKYIVGEELGVSIINTWVPKGASTVDNKIYGKCLSVDITLGTLEIETYFGSLENKLEEKIFSGGNCIKCGIYNEYQDKEYICWGCKVF